MTISNISDISDKAHQKLTIAILSVEYPPDPYSAGIGSYSKTIATALTNLGHQVHIITRAPAEAINAVPASDSMIIEEGIIVHRLSPLRPNLPDKFELNKVISLVSKNVFGELRYRHKVSRTLQRLIRSEGIDIIEATDFMAESYFFPHRHHKNIPFVIRLHTPFAYAEKIEAHAPDIMRQIMAWFEKQNINKATHLSAPSKPSAEIFRKELKLANQHIEIIPNPPNFQVTEDKYLTSNYSSPDNLVVFIGRISKWKGVDILCRSIKQVLAEHPNTEFCFVGADHIPVENYPSGKDYLLSLVEPEFHNNMTFTGYLQKPDVQTYITKADLCVLPSRFDNFPYTCLEAMIHAKAIVGSINGGMKEMLDDGKAGRLYTPPDHNELAQHINELLGDTEQRERLGKAARARALQHYNIDTVLEQTLKFYYQCIDDCK